MRKTAYILVVIIGALQILGFLIKNDSLRGIGLAFCSSPLPIVFTQVKGVETFASDFIFSYVDHQGTLQQTPVTPEIYSRFKGPYNRRNIYGASIAYGPVLSEEIWQAVLQYGLCNSILQEELGMPIANQEMTVIIKSRTKDDLRIWNLNSKCQE